MGTFYEIQDGPVNALALNRDYTQVVIGGRNVFKIYQIEEGRFRELCNLRTLKHLNLNFSCNDVAWSPTDDQYVATAATNGHVTVWNLNKMGKAMQEQDYQDHKRTVNKVNFHATESGRLISGSQDGTMRYFDIRVRNAVSVFVSNTESVRDVQFSPHSPYTFAAVSENGNVQIWDLRRTEKFQQQFTAHSGPVFACDWHPEQPWIATASRDKTIKVWDLSSKNTLEHTIHTIASIGRIKWRPQYRYHIASCALVIDCSINVWDVRRPYIPLAAFNEHRDITSGMAWRGDPNVFLSSGRDNTLYQHSFADGQKPATKANPQGISLNTRGEVVYSRKVATTPTIVSCNSSSQNSLSKAVGLMRKISTTQTIDSFHLAASCLYDFNPNNVEEHESSIFLRLAKNYVLHGRSVSELCERNAVVAEELGKSDVAVTWRIIKTMYGEEFVQNAMMNPPTATTANNSNNAVNNNKHEEVDVVEEPKSKGAETPAAQFSGGDEETENEDQVDHAFPNYLNVRNNGYLPKGDFFFGENELDVELDGAPAFMDFYQFRLNQTAVGQIDWSLPNEAFPTRHEILDRSPPPEQFPDHHQSINFREDAHTVQVDDQLPGMLANIKGCGVPSWDPSGIVIETLHHYATLGDVQTVACVLIVLGESRRFLTGLTEITQEHWILGYIDLLSRYKLWNISNEIIKLSWLPNVSQLNQQSTTMHTNCGKCMKLLQRVGWLCDRCHTSEYGLCSICHQVVRGLYVWCQGCSHGGHVGHMRQWLSKNKLCPTGCGHLCEFN
ncbi:GATOR complex protein WDR24 [Anthonomus grandis grandis]|uniref:GATOR complex protein WDR24 n=1 Tax=Anthonomus grandis grandis TaxID=2921223 RepID=UPI0021659DBC|nr:GATOR complex protein WDR24 [Anthonomus grandis grandis]